MCLCMYSRFIYGYGNKTFFVYIKSPFFIYLLKYFIIYFYNVLSYIIIFIISLELIHPLNLFGNYIFLDTWDLSSLY